MKLQDIKLTRINPHKVSMVGILHNYGGGYVEGPESYHVPARRVLHIVIDGVLLELTYDHEGRMMEDLGYIEEAAGL